MLPRSADAEEIHPSGPQGVSEICPLLGRPCPEAVRLTGQMVAAVRAARLTVGPEFRLDGRVEINGCRVGCLAAITTTANLVRVICTSGATVERSLLEPRHLT